MHQERQSTSAISLRPREVGCRVPLTTAALRGWKFYSDVPVISTRTSCASVGCRGTLDVNLLRTCIRTVVRRHEALRTRIIALDGSPLQYIDEDGDVQLCVVEAEGGTGEALDRKIQLLATELMKQKVDLSVGPLFAARLLRFSAREHVLICALAPVISDATSVDILFQEIWTLYDQGARGLPFSLPPVLLQFGDYAVWEQKSYAAWRATHEAYWKSRLTGAPALRLPGGSAWKGSEGIDSEVACFSFGTLLGDRLQEVAKRERVLLPLVLCTIYVAVTFRWCAQDESVLWFVSNGRYSPELRGTIGFLVNVLNLRISMQPDDTFLSLLRRLKQEFYLALKHHDCNRVFDIVPELLSEPTDLIFNWLPSCGDGWSPLLNKGQATEAGLRVEQRTFHRTLSAGFRLAFLSVDAEICVSVAYLSEQFPLQVVERFVQNLRLFAEKFAQNPATRIGRYE